MARVGSTGRATPGTTSGTCGPPTPTRRRGPVSFEERRGTLATPNAGALPAAGSWPAACLASRRATVEPSPGLARPAP